MSTKFPGLSAGTIVFFGLILAANGALAHDDHYDNSKPPHEAPHKAEPPTGGHKNLAMAATNPVANLMQLQLQNQYNWENHKSSGYSNTFLIQPVVPIKLPFDKVPVMISRTTVPWVSTPDLGTPAHRKHGMGDTTTLGLFIPKFGLKGQTIGLGYSVVIPTAGDNDFTGSGKWQIGPSFVYINQKVPKLQFGILGWHQFTIAETSAGKDKKNVTTTFVQPFVVKHWGKGWYAATQDVPWEYNHKSEKWTVPIGPRLGRVMKMGKQPVNLIVETFYNPNSDGPNAEWSVKFNFTLLIPE
jgi:hypothetical protein